MDYRKIIKQAIDLHVHVGPEIIPRRFTVPELLIAERGRLRGLGVKNHFFPTVAMARPPRRPDDPLIIDSVVLNRYSGGFNAALIRSAAALTPNPLLVWFPTLDARAFMAKKGQAIPSEWLGDNSPSVSSNTNRRPLTIWSRRGRISPAVRSVLQAIKDCDAILATGHLSWPESLALIKTARQDFGLTKIIVTHPIYPPIAMPLAIQRRLAKQGALLEQCYSMYSLDRVPIKKIVQQIRAVGAANCLLSSDVGQNFSPSPSVALRDFCRLLAKAGLSERELRLMLVANPRRLIFPKPISRLKNRSVS